MVTRAEIILAAKDTTQAAFAAVSRSFDSISTKATSVSAGVAGLGAVIGGALALTNAKGLIDVLDGLDEMSEKTGVSVEKLSELRYAGETSGTSLEALSSGFSKLSKLMAEAAGGGKEAESVFKSLGVSFKNADGTLRAQEDVLGDIADKFAGYEDGAGKAALAQKVFVKSGADMIGLLNLGKQGIADLRTEAQQLGAIYSGDLAKDAATFNDNLKKLELASQAASIAVGGPLLGSLARITNQIIEAKKEGSLLNAVLVAIGGGVARTLGVDEIGKAQTKAKDATAEMGRLQNIMTGLDLQLQRDPGNEMAQRRMATTRAKFDEARKQAAAASEELKTLANAADPPKKPDEKKPEDKKTAPPVVPSGGASKKEKDPQEATLRYLEGLDKQIEKAKELSQVEMALTEIQRLRVDGGTVTEAQKQSILQRAAEIDIIKEREKLQKEADRDREEAQRRFMADQDEARRVIESTFTPLETYSQKLTDLATLKAKGVLTSEQYSRAVAREAGAYGEAQAAADEASKHVDQFAQRGAQNIQDSLGQGLYDSLSGNFDDIGKNFGNMIKRMVAEAAAAQLARAMFGDLIQGGSGSGIFGTTLKGIGSVLGFGGSSGYTASQMSSLDGLVMGLSGARAAGGPVGADGTYLVGEKGPELFTPSSSGTIIPNHELGGGGGGVSVVSNYSIQIDARADKGEIYAGVQRMLAQNNKAQDERLKRLKVLPQ